MTDEAMSPLRRRMIEDMTIRKLAPKTQQGYIRTIKEFAAFLGRSPDRATFEDVRRFQLHRAHSGADTSTLNHTALALRFFFRVTLKQPAIVEHTQFVRQPRRRRAGSRLASMDDSCLGTSDFADERSAVRHPSTVVPAHGMRGRIATALDDDSTRIRKAAAPLARFARRSADYLRPSECMNESTFRPAKSPYHRI